MAINYPGDPDVKIVRDKDGPITSFTDITGTSSAVYYPSTWLKTFTNGAGKTVTYEYNGVGLVGRLIAPDTSKWFTYNYDARNLLSSVVDQDSTTLSSFTYDNGGRRTQVSRPGSYIQYQYNARDWVTRVSNRTSGGAEIYDACYWYECGSTWDHTGNPLQRQEIYAASRYYYVTLGYDSLYRQTQETKVRCCGGPVQYDLAYSYDEVGNRTSRVKDGVTVTYSYDDNDKLISASDGSSFGYDGAGNMTSVSGPLGSWGLTYDDESRLCVVTYPHDGGSATDYHWYNALGQRTRAKLQNDAQCISYVYNGERVLEEDCLTGSLVGGRYATESGSYFAPLLQFKRVDGSVRYPLYDIVGTVRGLADAAGNVTDLYTLDSFGAPHGSTGTTPNPYRFGGAWGYITDTPGSGMLQLGQRYYWPEIGRFVSRDPVSRTIHFGVQPLATLGSTPVGLTINANPYQVGPRASRFAYAGNKPVRNIDPSGYDYLDISFGFGALGPAGIAGIMIGRDPCEKGPWRKRWLHPYVGGGGGSPGPSFGLMYGTGDPSSGWYAAGAGGFIVGGSAGVDQSFNPFYEFGLSTPGGFSGYYHVW